MMRPVVTPSRTSRPGGLTTVNRAEFNTAVDARIALDFSPKPAHRRPPHDEIVRAMNRIMKPNAVAVIGASAEAGKIGNSVMKNLINGGYEGKIYPIHPKAEEIEGIKAYSSVKAVDGEIDMAVFAIPMPPDCDDSATWPLTS